MHFFSALIPLLTCAAVAVPHDEIVGNLRIQALTKGLVRIEAKGPKGFENRTTFHVVDRDFPGIPLRRTQTSNTVTLDSGSWRLQIPVDAKTPSQVSLLTKKTKTGWSPSEKLSNSEWFPAPGDMPAVWSFADSPRIIPTKEGIVPSATNDPDSGWDLLNDAPDVYVFIPGSYEQVRKDFLKLTGPVPMPPLYALGFVDSRYYAYTAPEALARIDEYHKRQVPLDMFVMDTDWRMGGSHGYKADPKYFPDMPAFLREAKNKDVKIMFNDHPEPQAKTALDPAEVAYRFNGLSKLMKEGVDVWWYDRNWNVGLVQPAPHLAREVWGMKLYHDVTLKIFPEKRPLIMANVDGIDNGYRNRPPNVAAHRYPVQWTGDTLARYEFLRKGVENAVFEGVQGLNPWVNEDLGGHAGHPTDDLYIRYLQFGSVSPMMRIHCTKGDTREPWSFGPEAEKIAIDYIKMRYQLMLLFYSLSHEAHVSGTPLLRRCDLQFPKYAEAALNDQFLLSDSILVAPIVGGQEAKVAGKDMFPNGLTAEYFANKDVLGEPTVKGRATNIDFNWGQGSPDPKIPTENFSARWQGKFIVPSGHKDGYRLSVTGDDGVRLWIDGKLVIDKWIPQDSVTTEAPVTLTPGSTHDLKLEFMDVGSGALVKLRIREVADQSLSERSVWIPPGTWTNVWTGKSYTGPINVKVMAKLSEMPMFLRSNAIVPIVPLAQKTADIDFNKTTLHVLPGDGSLTLYNDDGVSNNYLKGERSTLNIKTRLKGDQFKISVDAKSGKFPLAVSEVKLQPSTGEDVATVLIDGKSVPTSQTSHPFWPIKLTSVTLPPDGKAHTLIVRLKKR